MSLERERRPVVVPVPAGAHVIDMNTGMLLGALVGEHHRAEPPERVVVVPDDSVDRPPR